MSNTNTVNGKVIEKPSQTPANSLLAAIREDVGQEAYDAYLATATGKLRLADVKDTATMAQVMADITAWWTAKNGGTVYVRNTEEQIAKRSRRAALRELAISHGLPGGFHVQVTSEGGAIVEEFDVTPTVGSSGDLSYHGQVNGNIALGGGQQIRISMNVPFVAKYGGSKVPSEAIARVLREHPLPAGQS